MLQLNKLNKKGLSIIIGYVLLIIISISLALLVYAWLKGFLPKEKKECPDNIALTIEDYSCDTNNPEDKKIRLVLRNRGLFNLDGFVARFSKLEGKLPTYSLEGEVAGLKSYKGNFFFPDDAPLKPEQEISSDFYYSGSLFEIEIIPARIVDKDRILCTNAKIRQKVDESECTGLISPEAVCGNGIIETGEQCDDGNTISGDGCNSNCQNEAPGCIPDGNVCTSSSQCCGYPANICYQGTCQPAVVTYSPEAGWWETTKGTTSLWGFSEVDANTYLSTDINIISNDADSQGARADTGLLGVSELARTGHKLRFKINEPILYISKMEIFADQQTYIQGEAPGPVYELNLYIGKNTGTSWIWETPALATQSNPINVQIYEQKGSITSGFSNYIDISTGNEFLYFLLYSYGQGPPAVCGITCCYSGELGCGGFCPECVGQPTSDGGTSDGGCTSIGSGLCPAQLVHTAYFSKLDVTRKSVEEM